VVAEIVNSLLANVHLWPFFTVKDVLNVAESNFRFASESGRSKCWDMGSSLRLLMAESSHSMSVYRWR